MESSSSGFSDYKNLELRVQCLEKQVELLTKALKNVGLDSSLETNIVSTSGVTVVSNKSYQSEHDKHLKYNLLKEEIEKLQRKPNLEEREHNTIPKPDLNVDHKKSVDGDKVKLIKKMEISTYLENKAKLNIMAMSSKK